MPVLDSETGELLGTVANILIHPDTGKVEGFFVRIPGLFAEQLFLGSDDIRHWGTRITVRGHDALSPVDDRVRLQPLLDGHRPVLGQKILTESGASIGRCRDVQFSTVDFRLEWLFPRKFFRWSLPVPVSQILEVKPEAIVIKDPAVTEGEPEVRLVPPMPEAA